MTASLWPGILLLIGGMLGTAWGYRRVSLYRLIAGTGTTDVVDVDEPGRVELKGTARPVDGETTEGPMTGTGALAAGWRVDEWDERGDHSHWKEVAEGYDAVPFVVEDGTAEIRVDPGSDASSSGVLGRLDFGDLNHSVGVDDVTVDFRTLSRVDQVAPDGAKPPRIERFEAREPTVGGHTGSVTNLVDIGKKHGERRYYEGTIEPGDEVYVLGEVQPRDETSGETHLLRRSDAVVRPGDEEFVLSARSESELRSETGLGAIGLALGIVCLGVGLNLLLG